VVAADCCHRCSAAAARMVSPRMPPPPPSTWPSPCTRALGHLLKPTALPRISRRSAAQAIQLLSAAQQEARLGAVEVALLKGKAYASWRGHGPDALRAYDEAMEVRQRGHSRHSSVWGRVWATCRAGAGQVQVHAALPALEGGPERCCRACRCRRARQVAPSAQDAPPRPPGPPLPPCPAGLPNRLPAAARQGPAPAAAGPPGRRAALPPAGALAWVCLCLGLGGSRIMAECVWARGRVARGPSQAAAPNRVRATVDRAGR
jgi:hypothetical protein